MLKDKKDKQTFSCQVQIRTHVLSVCSHKKQQQKAIYTRVICWSHNSLLNSPSRSLIPCFANVCKKYLKGKFLLLLSMYLAIHWALVQIVDCLVADLGFSTFLWFSNTFYSTARKGYVFPSYFVCMYRLLAPELRIYVIELSSHST